MKKSKKILSLVLVLAMCFSMSAMSIESEESYQTAYCRAAVSELQSWRSNRITQEDDEGMIEITVNIFLNVLADQKLNPCSELFDYDIFFDSNSPTYSNLEYAITKLELSREIWFTNGVEVLWSNINNSIGEIEIIDDTATLSAYSSISEIYNGNEDVISSEGTKYYLTLTKIGTAWYISDLTTNDPMDQELSQTQLELKIDDVRNNVEFVYDDNSTSNDNIEYSFLAPSLLTGNWMITTIDIDRFVEYATNYSRTLENASDYYNNGMFYNYSSLGGDCTNFASQCIWYGLGGINKLYATNGKFWPMVELTGDDDREWYQYGTYWASSPNYSWVSVEGLKNYLVSGGSYIEGLAGTSTNGIAYAEVGDIIQVETSGDWQFDHSYVVTAVTGTSGNRNSTNITVCSHTIDAQSVLLSNYYSSSNSYRTLHIDALWNEGNYMEE